MNKPFKFALPPPNFNKIIKDACKPKTHFLTPSGMSLLPREKQPPPMYGKHGATVPARLLPQQNCNNRPQQQIAETPVEKQYCEPCELEFHSVDDLKRHRAQHEKCPVAGCNYKGHPSVMDKHINALHASGLFEKFKKLSTPEEIAAWREERRKRYPTLANVMLKQKAQEQRQKRGERLEANKNRFGNINDRKRAQPSGAQDKSHNEAKKSREDNATNNKNNKRNRKNKRKQNIRNQDKTTEQKVETRKDTKENQVGEDIQTQHCGIKMFTGTSQFKVYQHFNDKKKAVINNVLFGLVGMYGSDDDEDESDEENDKDNEQKQTVLSTEFGKEDNSDGAKNTEDDDITKSKENIGAFTNKLNNFVEIKNNINTNDDIHSVSDSKEIETNDIATKELSQENLSLNSAPFSNLKEINSTITHLNTPIEGIPHIVSEDNYSDEAPEEAPIQKTPTDLSLKSDSISNTEPAVKSSKLEDKVRTTLKQRLSTRRKYGLDYRKARLRKQNTMLEKLLETDIRHERNVLLQCVRYVCENNFFNIGQKNQEKPD